MAHDQEVVGLNPDIAKETINMPSSFGPIIILKKNYLGIVAFAVILQLGGWSLWMVGLA
jgi:hypothetical protein